MKRAALVTAAVFAASFLGCNGDHYTADVTAQPQELTTATGDPSRYWDHTFLRVELPDSDFDDTSKQLYVQLVKQNRAWQSGLIHYLGLNRYTGIVNPSENRTIWWSTTVRGEDGEQYRLYLADRAHVRLSPDGSAYIVTDADFNLIYWHGTEIFGNKTHHHDLEGERLPVQLSFTHDSFHNGDTSRPTYLLSRDGIRKVK